MPSASVAALCGLDAKNTVWGKKGDFKASEQELAKMVKAGPGTMCSYCGEKIMIVKEVEGGSWFGASQKNCIVIKKLKKCALIGICSKDAKDKLIADVIKFSAPLAQGGY